MIRWRDTTRHVLHCAKCEIKFHLHRKYRTRVDGECFMYWIDCDASFIRRVFRGMSSEMAISPSRWWGKFNKCYMHPITFPLGTTNITTPFNIAFPPTLSTRKHSVEKDFHVSPAKKHLSRICHRPVNYPRQRIKRHSRLYRAGREFI